VARPGEKIVATDISGSLSGVTKELGRPAQDVSLPAPESLRFIA
jgi:hypothetical protein